MSNIVLTRPHALMKRRGNVWPASRQTALGAFLFLRYVMPLSSTGGLTGCRFICPAIVAPRTIDIEVPKENNEIRRALILMTKIIQNLANNVLFGKEQFLTELNPFLNENARKVQAFQETVVVRDVSVQTRHTDVLQRGASDGEHRTGNPDVGAFFDETDAIVLQRFFQLHADKVGKELLSFQGGDSSTISGKKTWDMLCTALVELGQPIERPQLIPIDSQRHPKLVDFVNRNSHRSTDSVRHLFFETSTDPVCQRRMAMRRAVYSSCRSDISSSC